MRLSILPLALALGLTLGACDSSDDPEATFGDDYTVLVNDNSPVIRDGRVRVEVELGVQVEYCVENSRGCEKPTFLLRSRVDGKEAEVWFVYDAEGNVGDDSQQVAVTEDLPETVLEAERVTLLTPPSSGRLSLSAAR